MTIPLVRSQQQNNVFLKLLEAREIAYLAGSHPLGSRFETVALRDGPFALHSQMIGIMGMTVDPNTGHIWWSYNHGNGHFYEMNAHFQPVGVHHPVQATKYSLLSKDAIVENFRDLCFVGSALYSCSVVDERKGLHIFSMPGFEYQKTIPLGFGKHPEYLVSHLENILLCIPDIHFGKGTMVTEYSEASGTSRNLYFEKTGSFFSAGSVLQAIHQDVFVYGDREKTKYSLVTFDAKGTLIEKKPFDSTNFFTGVAYLTQRPWRHPSGLLFFYGWGELEGTERKDRTLEVLNPNGKHVQTTHLDFGISTACFDVEGNFLAIASVRDDAKRLHLYGLKYEVQYDPAILATSTPEPIKEQPRGLRGLWRYLTG